MTALKTCFSATIVMAASIIAGPALGQQASDDPAATEVWEPVPAVVTPGVGAQPPSDAIVLFDGTDLDHW